MATSLTSQLENLRTSAARHLTVEKRHVSLLFDRKEAGKLTNETAHRIGVAGLEQMKRIDPIFDTEIANDLFSDERVDFVRSMLEKEANESLNKQIEKLLLELSPYLQHFACQQVLEYLVHTYQIYSFNAETLLLTFLPFHETKVYSRLLRILDFDWTRSKEWQFMQQYLRSETPIPFSSISKATLASKHSIISCITDHIKKAVDIVGSDYLEIKHPSLFNFHAKLLLSMFNDPEKVDEMMLAKLIPFIEHGIKSPMKSFRYSAMVVISQLVLTVKLKEDVLNSLCKLLITKMRSDTSTASLNTLMVVFQQQNVENLSKNTLKKLLRHDEDIDMWKALRDLSERTDTSKFYNILWKELVALSRDSESDEQQLAIDVLLETSDDASLLTSEQAKAFLKLILEEAMSGNLIDKKNKMKGNIRAIGIRFAKQFDEIYEELKEKDKKALKRIVKEIELEDVVQMASEYIEVAPEAASEDVEEVPKKVHKPLTATEKAAQLAANSEFSKREVFSGDPIKEAIKWIHQKKWEKVEWALNEMAQRGEKYFGKKVADDVEEFVVEIVKICGNGEVKSNGNVDASSVKAALAGANLSPQFITSLLTKFDDAAETAPKRAKGPAATKKNVVEKTFGNDESWDDFNGRVVFVLDLLNARQVIPSSDKVLAAIFGIVKQTNSRSDAESSSYQQHLAVNAIRKILEHPGKTKIGSSEVDMDCVIETMRSTHNHHLLRDCLRLIVAAAKHTPNSVVKHVMSVFTFMGNGMLRKDNELTLTIVEKTVESLFATIINSGGALGQVVLTKQQQTEKLIELARLFAASAVDIPAHRRARIAQAIARAVGSENASTVVLVLVSSFCARWQRSTDAGAQEALKKGSDQEAYDDLAIELLSALNPFEQDHLKNQFLSKNSNFPNFQLSSVLEMCEYVRRLGGDKAPTTPKSTITKKDLDTMIFDRTAQTLPRIRHFRYVVVTLIARIFSNRVLIERLAAYDDEELLKNALPLGKRLIECSVELDEFANKEANAQDGSDPQAQRYWVAFASKTEIVSEKLRHLLPGGVAARLIADVLQECVNEKKLSYKMCEKVLQLANIKLGHDGYLFSDSGINEKELITLAQALNKFIVAETKSEEKMRMCQNSAFTLKLIAKNLPSQSESLVLADTMQRCVSIVSQYQKLDENLTGNVLLLAGEMIRSHNMRSTIHHASSLLKTCLATVQECIQKFSKSSQFDSSAPSPGGSVAGGAGRANRGHRIRQQSLGGNKFGSDTLLICSLTCIQRVFDQFASFVVESTGDVVIRYCRLISRFGDPSELLSLNQPSSSSNAFQYDGGSQTSGFGSKSGIHRRLSCIRRSLLSIEMRVLPAHIVKAVGELKSEKKALCALFNLLSGFIETQHQQKPDALRKAVVQLRHTFVADIITPSLEFRSQQRQAEVRFVAFLGNLRDLKLSILKLMKLIILDLPILELRILKLLEPRILELLNLRLPILELRVLDHRDLPILELLELLELLLLPIKGIMELLELSILMLSILELRILKLLEPRILELLNLRLPILELRVLDHRDLPILELLELLELLLLPIKGIMELLELSILMLSILELRILGLLEPRILELPNLRIPILELLELPILELPILDLLILKLPILELLNSCDFCKLPILELLKLRILKLTILEILKLRILKLPILELPILELPILELLELLEFPQFENVEKLEHTVFNFVVSIASILSEVEFRPVVNELVAWAEPGLESKADLASRLRLVSLLHFANDLYTSFNSLALPYFGRILEVAVSVLKRCNATLLGAEELLLSGKRGSIEALETDLALTLAIDVISNAARHRDFFTIDRCQLVSDVIVDELVNTKVEGHEKRCSDHLVAAIYRIGNADPDNFPELLNKIMLKTRDSRPKIRYRTLIVLDLLIKEIGDGVQPHLSILLPFLNELIEDENKQVEAQCQKVINSLQHKFGETFWSGS
ncbi:Protein CBR-TOE-1 [Caenorhabditis briggsae]|uniref:HEAT repeat-containing protein 1 n=2 Tax=Caenorhabditis briggsae TaxID=6238 RepID=A8WVL2_CAEBR|nr:Protein CBR-TOE-1 [Caenorhabditis briggsae]CAP24523.2 Protein CBR-TOE-1 [Caenorhabditis briggsae]